MTQLPIPVLVGSETPECWDDIEARQKEYGENAAPWLQKQRRPAVASADLDWTALGFEPRWIGFDTADCAVALQPSVFASHDADEFDRFRQGAESRGELAIVISPVGQPDGREARSVLATHDDSVFLGRMHTSVSSRPLGKGARVKAAADLSDADSHLALRLLSFIPALPWRSLSLHGMTLEGVGGRVQHPAQGTLLPILETALGEPVAAVWISPDGIERRYVVPLEAPWELLLQWLQEQALPEFVPNVLRRARRPLATDDSLMTRRERAARAALTQREMEYAARRAEAIQELDDAKAGASDVRDGLLYGTGSQLVDAVRAVLTWAEIAVVDLDDHLGGTRNADLLCTFDGRSRLVEVKSASGNAPERAYEDLVRHLREWPDLPGSTPVDGGALVINHQLRSILHERSPQPYGRPEFLASQTEPVVTTLDLFAAWREEDRGAVRRLLFGDAAGPEAAPAPGDTMPKDQLASSGSVDRKRGWLRRR
jgi:hypothetical protein